MTKQQLKTILNELKYHHEFSKYELTVVRETILENVKLKESN